MNLKIIIFKLLSLCFRNMHLQTIILLSVIAVVTSQGTNNIFYIAHLHTNVQLFSECILVKPKNTNNSCFLIVCCVLVFYVFCVVLCFFIVYGPFCQGAFNLDMSTLFTTLFYWTSLQFILSRRPGISLKLFFEISCKSILQNKKKLSLR